MTSVDTSPVKLAGFLPRLMQGADALLARPEWLIIGYFTLHTLMRALMPVGPGVDEAGELVSTQALQWGYGPQPPLYTWLQWGLFRLFGEGAFALGLLKNLLLAVTYLAVLRLSRRLLVSGPVAVAGMMGLLLLPQVAWESQRALSHTVLAVALTALAVDRMFALMEARRWRDYVLLGVLLGLGLLSKYNFPFLPAAVMLAALTRPIGRAAFLDRRMGVVLLIAGLLALPHGLWAFSHMQAVTAHLEKFEMGHGILLPRLKGLVVFLGAAVAFLALLVAVHGAVLWRSRDRATSGAVSDEVRILALALALAAAGIVLLVLVTGATNVKDRWLQPLLFLAPVVAAGFVAVRRDPAVLAWVNRAGVALMLVVLVALPINNLTEETSVETWHHVAEQLRKAVPDARLIVTDRHAHAGDLRFAELHRPGGGWATIDDDMPDLAIDARGPAIIVWEKGMPPVPSTLVDIARDRLGPGTLGERQVLEVQRSPGSKHKLGLGFAVYRPE